MRILLMKTASRNDLVWSSTSTWNTKNANNPRPIIFHWACYVRVLEL